MGTIKKFKASAHAQRETTMNMKRYISLAMFNIGLACASAQAAPQAPSAPAPKIDRSAKIEKIEKIDMLEFNSPTLGGFLTPIIKARNLDTKNGIDLNFIERTPDVYLEQFNSGQYQVGGSAGVLSIGAASNQGAKVVYLFNMFDYFGAVVTDNPNIKTLKDLEGKKLIAATSTTNYAMFKWLAVNKGIDLSKITVQNSTTPQLLAHALTDHGDPVQLWEPIYSVLMVKKPSLRALEFDVQNLWKKFSGTGSLPYLGVAAHEKWVKQNPHLVEKMYLTFKEAADWVQANPAEAAKIVAATIKGADPAAIQALIQDNNRLGLNVVRASQIRLNLQAVYTAGLQSGFLKQFVSSSTIYSGNPR
jgi:NitT/TauT family transport system substrate-binding protein